MATEIKISAEIFHPEHLGDTYGPHSSDKVHISAAEARGADDRFIVFRFEDTYSGSVAIREDDLLRALRALGDHRG